MDGYYSLQKDPANRIWTGDLRITGIDNYSPPLYQLSYRGLLYIDKTSSYDWNPR